MLTHPTVHKLSTLRLHGMLAAFEEQMSMEDMDELGFEERLGLLVDRELTERHNRRLTTRLRKARFRLNACMEDIDFRKYKGSKSKAEHKRSGQVGSSYCKEIKRSQNFYSCF